MRVSLKDYRSSKIAATTEDPSVANLFLEDLEPSENLLTKDFHEVDQMARQMSHGDGGWPEKMPFVSVTPDNGKYRVLDGHHSCLAAYAADLNQVPCLVFTDENHYNTFRHN